LLLSIIPFEKEWYAARVPKLRVEFVGHPIVDRCAPVGTRCCASEESAAREVGDSQQRFPTILLLPGSRQSELRRHLPVMIEAARLIQKEKPGVRFKMVLPSEELKQSAVDASALLPGLLLQVGGLTESLLEADLAIASTGTVMLECAMFGVPTVAIYKTSWSTYFIARQIVTVKHLAMPNLLGDEAIYPELIQGDATGENIAREALDLLNNAERRRVVKTKLTQVVKSLGEPGASQRAAEAVLGLLE
jgi:lipid-A-disaccharide synthase